MTIRSSFTVAVVGDPLQTAMTAAYLYDGLKTLSKGCHIIPIVLNEGFQHDELRHAFTPFTRLLATALKKSPYKKVKSLAITMTAGDPSFHFNFSDYGIPSATTSFLQAYEVATSSSKIDHRFDSFLDINGKSFGALYKRGDLARAYRSYNADNGIYSIYANSIGSSVHDGQIEAITTECGQSIAADLFIDCSKNAQIYHKFQQTKKFDERHIPPYSATVVSQHETCEPVTVAAKNNSITYTATYDEDFGVSYDFGVNPNNGGIEPHFFEKAWTGNCIAAGNCYANIPDLLICRDRILETQLQTLCELLPSMNEYAASHYGMLSNRLLTEATDIINLLLSANSKNLSLTPKNEIRKQLYTSSATTHKEDNSMVSENNWGALLRCSGHIPLGVNAITAVREKDYLTQKVNEMLNQGKLK